MIVTTIRYLPVIPYGDSGNRETDVNGLRFKLSLVCLSLRVARCCKLSFILSPKDLGKILHRTISLNC